MRRLIRFFLVMIVGTGLLVIPSSGLFTQESAADGGKGSQTSAPQEEEITESLRKALVELVRAGGFMKSNDTDQAVAKYMEAFEIDEGIRWYDDQGILNEIIRRYSKTGPGGTGGGDTRKLKVKLKSAEVEIEQLTREKERLEDEIKNLQIRLDETAQELEEEIAALEAEFEEMRHQRAFWRGRYLRKQGYGYSGASQGEN